jgi:hypothetical protein
MTWYLGAHARMRSMLEIERVSDPNALQRFSNAVIEVITIMLY